MLALVVATALNAQAVADSPFRLRPETSQVRLLAQNESGLSPPPMPVMPQADPAPLPSAPASFPAPRVTARLIDPDANGLNLKEVLVGFASGLGIHLVAGVGVAFGLFVALASTGGSVGPGLAIGALIAVLGALAVELFSPLLIAYFEGLAADKAPMAGSFGKSVGLAYAAFGTGIVLNLILTSVMIGGIADPMVGLLTGIGLSLLMLVGVPVAASFGRHWGPAMSGGTASPSPELSPRTEPLFAALPKPIGGLGVSLRF